MLDLDFLAFPWARNEWIVSAGITACTGVVRSRGCSETRYTHFRDFQAKFTDPAGDNLALTEQGKIAMDHAAVGVSWRNIA